MKRETVITSVVDGRPEQVLIVPGNSWWPMLAAIATGGFFIGATFHWWIFTGVSAVLAFALILGWVWNTAGIPDVNQREAGCGYVLPRYVSGPDSVGWWAMFITIIGDGTAFAGVIFGYFFYWTASEAWPPPEAPDLGLLLPGLAALLLAVAAGLIRFSIPKLRFVQLGQFQLLVTLGTLAMLASGGVQLIWLFGADLQPSANAYPAIIAAIFIYHLLHVFLAVVMGIYVLARYWTGRLRPGYDIDLRNSALFWYFVTLMGLVALGVTALFPLVS